MKLRSHRGGVYYAPENTMPAFRYAIDGGYDYIETDPQLTRDGKVVLMHDVLINRTCRNADGSAIATPIKVSDITYEELLGYDAGLALGEEFRGTRVPLLDELLALAEARDTVIALDKRIPTDRIDVLLDVVAARRAKVSFSASTMDRIERIQARFPDAMFDYDVNTEEDALKNICRIIKPENLVIWLYLDKPNFSWLAEKAKATPENIARVRRLGRLGIANVNNPIDMKEAMDLCPDVLEI